MAVVVLDNLRINVVGIKIRRIDMGNQSQYRHLIIQVAWNCRHQVRTLLVNVHVCQA